MLNVFCFFQVGRHLTEYAARIFRGQCLLYSKEKYAVAEDGAESWTITNIKSGRQYHLQQQQSGSFVCSCYVSSSFGIACRHMLFQRACRGEDLFQPTDFLPRWYRDHPSASSRFDIFDLVAKAAFDGVPDEDVLDEECAFVPDTF